MRIALTCTLAVSVSLAALATAQAQKAAAPVAIPAGIPAAAVPAPAAMPAPAAKPAPAPAPTAAAAPAATAAPAPSGLPAAPKIAAPACANPNALGVSRTVEIDTTGAPGFGFEHFKQYDFLKPNEVVLTFDDGPWLGNTPAVLKALQAECVRAVFFIIGKHATYYPDILKQIAAEGHTVGSHTWSHKDLSKKTAEEATEEIEKGISAIKVSLGDTPAPFFRFPALRHPPEMVAYLGTRNIAMFSTDMDSFDFKFRKPEQIVSTVMNKLKKHGKGIVLMHDFQHGTAQAVPELLKQLKTGGYKIVHMKARGKLASVQKYDDMVVKELGPSMANAKPIDSVVRTVGE
jgi:peptidoglycan/xylan/chitin deacetylase (PgdA/CDA1 family)